MLCVSAISYEACNRQVIGSSPIVGSRFLMTAAVLALLSMPPSNAARNDRRRLAVRGVALIEFLKGSAILLIGAGFAAALHREHDIEDLAVTLLYALHLGNHPHLSAVFLRAADRLENTNLVLFAMAAGVYSLLRFVEAYGLWNGRGWAEWFALIAGAAYLPLEVYELFRRVTPVRLGILAVNLLIVACMGWVRWTAHSTPNLHRKSFGKRRRDHASVRSGADSGDTDVT